MFGVVVSGERFVGAWRGAAIIGRVPEVRALCRVSRWLAQAYALGPGWGWCMPALERDVIGA